MKICPQCREQMKEGYRLSVNTYGTPKVEHAPAKPGAVRVAVCPKCGELSLSADSEEA